MSKVRYLLGLTNADRNRLATALDRSIEIENNSAEAARLYDLRLRLVSLTASITEAEYAHADGAARAWLSHALGGDLLGKRYTKVHQQVTGALAKLRGLFT